MRLIKIENNGQIKATKEINKDRLTLCCRTRGETMTERLSSVARWITQRDKTGLKKIYFCRSQAQVLNDGLGYFWTALPLV